MRMKKLLALLLCVMMMLSTFGMLTATAAPQIKNIIYMIPDGGGMVPFNLADAVKQAGGVNSTFPNSTPQTVNKMYLADYLVGAETTYSNNQAVTDSAAGGTALATGKKTNNYEIGLDPSLRPIATILEAAQYVGKRAGLVSTYPWAHATPAAFSSHAVDRYDYRTIAQQQINQGLDIVLPFNATGAAAYDEAAADIAAHGYSSVTTVDQMLALESGAKVWGTLGGDHYYYNRDIKNAASYPNLAEMTTAAIQALEGSEEGFFLLVEGSAVDGGGHQSNALDMVTEFIAFDEACKVAIEYAKGRTDTVVVAAADHDTGGMNVLNQSTAISNIQSGVIPGTSVITWDGNGGHTARNCGVFMYVPDGVDRIPGVAPTSGLSSNFNNYVINNIDIAPWLAGLIGVDLDTVTDQLFVDVSALGSYTPTSSTYYDYDEGATFTSSDYTGTFKFDDYDLTVERNTSVATYNGQTIDLDGQVCVFSSGRFYVPQLLLDTVGIDYSASDAVTVSSSLTGSTLVGSMTGNSGCTISSNYVGLLLANQSSAYVTFEIGVPKTAYYSVQAMLTSSNGDLLCNNGLTATFDNGESATFTSGKTNGANAWSTASTGSVLLEQGTHTVTFRSGDLCSNIYIYGVQIVEDPSIKVDGDTTPVATPTPTEAPDYINFTEANAPYAGVYQVTSDKAVTLTNETGHTVTLAAGATDYFYLIKGNNNITTTDSSATLTWTPLVNNGMAYLAEVEVASTPITETHYPMGMTTNDTNVVDFVAYSTGNTSIGTDSISIPNSSSVTLKTPSLPAGIYYIAVQTSGANNYFTVTTDTGFTGQYYATNAGNLSYYEDSTSGNDYLMVYLREGENYITYTNNGPTTITFQGSQCCRSITPSNNADTAISSQVAMSACKVVADGYNPDATPAPTAEPTATPTPTATPIVAEGTINYTASYAGIYKVEADMDVSVSTELGSVAALTADTAGYVYLMKGTNVVSLTETDATVTFTELDNNGMDYLSQVTTATEPVISGQEDSVASGLNKSLAAGESYTFSYTPSQGKAGLVYPYIKFSDGNAGNTIRVSVDTGFYADLYPNGTTTTTWCWADAAMTDIEILYVRSGANVITIENLGPSTATIANINIHSAGELSSHATWGSQINVANLKVLGADVPEATLTPTPTPNVTGEVSYTNAPYAGVYQVTSDKAVTLTNETGHQVTLSAGGTDYFYMFKGTNHITTTDASASLTFTSLSGNGMTYINEVTVVSLPITSEHYVMGDNAIGSWVDSMDDGVVNNTSTVTVPAGKSFTLKTSGLPAGLYYISIGITDSNENDIRIETSTGYYGTFVDTPNGGTHYEDNVADFLLVYLQGGTNYIKVINEGTSASSTVSMIRAGRSSTFSTDSRMAMAYCKVIIDESTVPTPTPLPDNMFYHTAPYAGVYQVTSDKAVTLTNETGHTVTLAAGATDYFYFVQGQNIVTTTDTSATLTYTELDGNGLAYLSEVDITEEPYSSEETNITIGSTLAPGASITYTVTVTGGAKGLIYPYLNVRDYYYHTFKVTSDTGYYAELLKDTTDKWLTTCFADGSAEMDMEFLYLREGENTITITNTGSNLASLGALRLSMLAGDDPVVNVKDSWDAEMNMASLKVITDEAATPTATPAPTATPTPTPEATPDATETPDLSNISYTDAPYAGVYQVTSDKAVTLTNETGHTVTLEAGATDYFYLIKGNNELTISDSTATLTWTALDGNGWDYISEVDPGERVIASSHVNMGPYADPNTTLASFVTSYDDGVTVGSNDVTLPVGKKATFQVEVTEAGLRYLRLAITSPVGGLVQVETDTGYYAQVYQTASSTATWNEHEDADKTDLPLVYLRAGTLTFTLENIGEQDVVLYTARFGRTSSITGDGASYDTQVVMSECKVIPFEITEDAEPTPTPTPTPEPSEDIITYTAPFAGVYKVSADGDVTLTNETGSTATLTVGEEKYIYLIKGANIITTTNTDATVTFTALEGHGLDYIDQVETAYIAYGEEHVLADITNIIDGEGTYQTGTNTAGAYISLSPGAKVTVAATMSADGAGIIYPYLNVRDYYYHTFRITSDTGFYADVLKDNTTNWQTTCFADGTAGQDMEFLYVREGVNYFTIENTGSNTAIIGNLRLSMTDGEDSVANHTVWGPQINLNNLKVITEESEYTDFALDTEAATASVSFKQMNTTDNEAVSLIIAEYDATTGKLLQVNINPIDTSKQGFATTQTYSVSLENVTGKLKAMLINDNLVPYFTVAE